MLYHYVQCFIVRFVYFLPPAAFFGLFAFFVALLRAFFAGFAAVAVEVFAAAVEDAPAAPVDDLAARFVFDPPADFFFGDAAFFFGLLALALPAAFDLPDALDLGLAVRAVLAFLAVVAFFLGVAAADVAEVDGAVAVLVVAAAATLVLAVAAFFVDAFLLPEAERLRLAAPPVDLPLLDDRAFFVLVPPDFLLPPGVLNQHYVLVQKIKH